MTREEKLTYNKTRSLKFREQGLCYICGKVRDSKNKICKYCTNISNERRKNYRLNLISLGLCSECRKLSDRVGKLCTECLALNRKDSKTARTKLKDLVYDAYGGPICKCCSNTDKWALTIDHVNNNGAEHRRQVKTNNSTIMYRIIRDEGFPDTYQVLCANCQLGKLRNNGICPHSNKKSNTNV